MAGTVYLRTNRFEVKLEGITFKTKDFEALCKMDFLFPAGKVWARPPIVGLDVMRHPRDPSILLVLLCFGVGVVILRFFAGEALPAAVQDFLTDKRIHFVGFGVPEKRDLFPFEELGLTKNRVDIGYLAARILKDSKYKRWELAELARKVIGIKRMIGLTEASSFERHEQIKCAICQLFITSVIAMGLLGAKDKSSINSPKKSSFLKNLNSIQLLAEGWFKLPVDKKNMDDSSKKSSFLKNLNFSLKSLNGVHSLTEGWFKLATSKKKKDQKPTLDEDELYYEDAKVGEIEDMFGPSDFVKPKPKDCHFSDWFKLDKFQDSSLGNCFLGSKSREGSPGEDFYYADAEDDSSSNDIGHEEHSRLSYGRSYNREGIPPLDSSKDVGNASKRPLKGILKCPSSHLIRVDSYHDLVESPPTSSSEQQTPVRGSLRRANSKGFNVSFTL